MGETAWELLQVQTVYNCNVTAITISHSCSEYQISASWSSIPLGALMWWLQSLSLSVGAGHLSVSVYLNKIMVCDLFLVQVHVGALMCKAAVVVKQGRHS